MGSSVSVAAAGVPEAAPALRGRRALLGTGARGFADQLLFAGTHFLLNVFLARWLEPADYGAFALAYGLFLVADAFHEGLLAEPMLVFSQRRVVERLEDYLGALAWGFGALALGFGALLVSGALVLHWAGSAQVAVALLALGCATPLQMLALLARRLCYARLRPGVAAAGGAVYAGVVGALLVALQRAGMLSVSLAIASLAAGSLASAACIGWRLGLRPDLARGRTHLRRVLARHWSYGRWSMIASASALAPWNLHYPLLAGVLGLAGIAEVRALYNVLLPLRHLTSSLSVSMIPVLARQLASSQPRRARTTALWLALFHAASSLAWAGLMFAFGPRLLVWLYGGAYAAVYPLAGWMAAIQIPVGALVLLGIPLRAADRSERLLIASLAYALLSLLLGSAGAVAWGAAGLIGGILAAAVLALAMRLLQLRWEPPWPGAAGPGRLPDEVRAPGVDQAEPLRARSEPEGRLRGRAGLAVEVVHQVAVAAALQQLEQRSQALGLAGPAVVLDHHLAHAPQPSAGIRLAEHVQLETLDVELEEVHLLVQVGGEALHGDARVAAVCQDPASRRGVGGEGEAALLGPQAGGHELHVLDPVARQVLPEHREDLRVRLEADDARAGMAALEAEDGYADVASPVDDAGIRPGRLEVVDVVDELVLDLHVEVGPVGDANATARHAQAPPAARPPHAGAQQGEAPQADRAHGGQRERGEAPRQSPLRAAERASAGAPERRAGRRRGGRLPCAGLRLRVRHDTPRAGSARRLPLPAARASW